MWDQKAAINLLRSRRKQEPLPSPVLAVLGTPPPEPEPIRATNPIPIQGGLFIFERCFDISNYSLSQPSVWQAIAIRQGKATFERLRLPISFKPLTCAVYATVVSGYDSDAELAMQFVQGDLINTSHLNDDKNHLLTKNLVFDGRANPIEFLKVSSETKGPDLVIKADSQVKLLVEMGDCDFTHSLTSGTLKCTVGRKRISIQRFIDLLATSPFAKNLKMKVLSNPSALIDLTAQANFRFKPNNHFSEYKDRLIEPYEGLCLIAKMPNLDRIIQYELQVYIVCELKSST